MFDLHSHVLPGVDDGAPNLASMAMAGAWVEQGVLCVVCTPYQNTGPEIRQAVTSLQQRLDKAGIPLKLAPGADNHIVQEGERFVWAEEARHLVVTRPRGTLMNISPKHLPIPRGGTKKEL